VREAETFLHGVWPAPRATEFLEYVRSGNRSGYEALSFGRRQRLATLVLAECFEGKGRFRDDIVNGIWTICEETYWGVPAHVAMQRRGSGLPDVTEPTVDLFAAETGSLLAWTYYLLKDSLDVVSPLVSERIRYEVDRRINAANFARDDFWWMGLSRSVNNWNPWICSNWLASVLILEQDQERRARSVWKIMECLDRFLADYADDGGCDEGPGYWGRAGGSVFDCLELLSLSTDGYVDGFTQPRIKEMGRYIMRAHIHGPWFVNFADAAARLQPDAPTIYRYGKAIGDAAMMAFGARLAQDQHLGKGMLPGQYGVLGRVLPAMFVLKELLKARPARPYIRDSWFPGIQVMTARSSAGSPEGLFLAVQGGHNDENHNHNDVGNFVVYLDGEPAIIDIGVETYTAKTFSKDRYSIWTMQSGYHNLPTINGVSQKEGKSYAAKDVRYEVTDSKASLSMDIAGAYPLEADVLSWRRTLSLERGHEVTIRDVYELRSIRDDLRLTLMTCREPIIESPGAIILGRPPGATKSNVAEVTYDSNLFSARVEPIDIRDPQLQSSWGKRIWRILLTMQHPALKNEFDVHIRERQSSPRTSLLKPLVEHALDVAQVQSLTMALSLKDLPGRLPKTLTPDGKLETCGPEWWTSGFFPGILWYLYESTGEQGLKSWAQEYTLRVESQKSVTSHHDVGFMIFSSFGNGYRLTKDPEYRQVLKTAALSLGSRFNPVIGAIRSWDKAPWTSQWQYPVIIDNMMNLEILMWAAREFGIKDFARIATTHANTTMRHHFREDYSTYHVVSYDTNTGKPELKQTAQGYSHESTWARGQAWGLYGFTMMYRETGDTAYLNQARGMADFIINHPNLPDDKIPYWDFDAPGMPNQPRDASAAAIICSALLELGRYVDKARSDAYRAVAETQIRHLSSPPYLAEKGTNGNFILKHGVGHKPNGTEVDVPLPYADYYFVESLMRYKKWYGQE
jgi:rhamnogalacturonyl hydrolase YesR